MSRPEVTLVTGASAGIGRAIAEALLAGGGQVVNLDYSVPTWSHAKLHSFQADLTSEAQTLAAAQQITAQFAITALVNNAGATRPGSIDSATVADLHHVVALHFQAAMLLTQQALPTLRACGHGRIVNIASRAALGKAERLVYSATKAGLIGMTRTLAMELGGDGITVNAVAPGPIATDLRFLTAGSVDDGKSTLIGRLLFDSRAILADQIDALEKRTFGTLQAEGGPGFDLSLLTDGLEAEREQGITIDVAYRYFATRQRKFIIADAPGHEQYTRNMVTAAAGSDAAVVLVDITKLDTQSATAAAPVKRSRKRAATRCWRCCCGCSPSRRRAEFRFVAADRWVGGRARTRHHDRCGGASWTCTGGTGRSVTGVASGGGLAQAASTSTLAALHQRRRLGMGGIQG